MRTWTVAIALLLFAGSASAVEVFTAILNGPNAGTKSPGTGYATFVLSDDATSIDYSMMVTGLIGVEGSSHVHRLVGGIAFDLGPGEPKSGTWQFPLPTDVARLRAGELYINVHTDLFPMAELRGTLLSNQTPVANKTWGAIKALYR